MRLSEGMPAVDFSVTDIHGNNIKLSNYVGKKVILSFLRHVNCPYCNVRVHKLIGNVVRLQRSGVQMILFFENSNEKLLQSVLHKGVSPFPIIGDPEKKVYNQYGVQSSVIKMLSTFITANNREIVSLAKTLETPKEKDEKITNSLIPADFFIDENLKIVKAHYGKNIDDHVTIDEVLKFAGVLTF